MRHFIPTFLLLMNLQVSAQINIADSSVRAVSYWKKGDVKQYNVVTNRHKVERGDTVSHERISYDVEVTVLNATNNEYVLQWRYSNVTSNQKHEAFQKIAAMFDGTSVVYKTRQSGAFGEVINWEEILEAMAGAAKKIKKDYAHLLGMEGPIDEAIALHTTKENITKGRIKDIEQLHTFHGGGYKLNHPVELKIKTPNPLGGDVFDANLIVYLDEINVQENNFSVRSIQTIDPKQLTSELHTYLKKQKMLEGQNVDGFEMKHELTTSSRIDSFGWIMRSVQKTIVSIGNNSQFEERVIEIKQ